MSSIVDRVRRSLQRDGLVPPGSRIVAAVSGGSDSVGLVVVLAELAGSLQFELVGIAHLNHQLRGAASDADERFCRDLAARLGLACDVGRTDVRALAASNRSSIEVAARMARYRFFDEAARRLDAEFVATGHTRDDQAETLLLHLLRGAGRRGLAGIPARRGRFVRPLLGVGRRELRSLIAERGFAYCEDATNADCAILRNWVRHELIPLVDGRLGGDLVTTLGRQTRILRDEDALLDSLAAQALPTVVGPQDRERGWTTLQAEALRRLPPALARRVLRLAAGEIDIHPVPGADAIEAAFELATASVTTPAVDLPGLRVERKGETVVLHNRSLWRIQRHPFFRYDLQVPGRLEAAEHGFALDARIEAGGMQVVEPQLVEPDMDLAILDVTCAAGGLRVRTWQPGDALVPLGMSGRKKLQDVFVDRKVPRGWRDRVPLVVDADDRILWVAGVVQSDRAKVTDRTQSVVTLRLSRLGDWP